MVLLASSTSQPILITLSQIITSPGVFPSFIPYFFLMKFPVYIHLQSLKPVVYHCLYLQINYQKNPDINLTYPQVWIRLQLQIWYSEFHNQIILNWWLCCRHSQAHTFIPVLCHLLLIIKYPVGSPLQTLYPKYFYTYYHQITHFNTPALILHRLQFFFCLHFHVCYPTLHLQEHCMYPPWIRIPV